MPVIKFGEHLSEPIVKNTLLKMVARNNRNPNINIFNFGACSCKPAVLRQTLLHTL